MDKVTDSRTLRTLNLVGVPSSQLGKFDPSIPEILPHEQVYSIQVGERLFRLSGASLSSDAPSYFTNFFLQYKDAPEEKRPTLYIDRSADVFNLICMHLQGYYMVPEDESMLVYVAADAQYYHLSKLVTQLATLEFSVRIGKRRFTIPRGVFNRPGDSPNFFTLGFATIFTPMSEEFRKAKNLRRPLPIAPPTVTDRSPEIFADLLTALTGSSLDIRSEDHREKLVRECRYYRFRALEQTLIAHEISNNEDRGCEEITLNLSDIKLSELDSGVSSKGLSSIYYKRPYTDTVSRELIIQIKAEQVVLSEYGNSWQCNFTKDAGEQIKDFTEVLNTNKSIVFQTLNDGYLVNLVDSYLEIGGQEMDLTGPNTDVERSRKRKRADEQALYLKQSQFRIVLNERTATFQLVKGVGISDIRSRNQRRTFI
jgi:BTB/POZ domain